MTSRTSLRATLGLAIVAAAAGGCAAGISYNHDYDPSANIVAFRTYIWAAAPENSRGVNRMIEARIITAIDQQLQAKGYRVSNTGEGDFAVNFALTTSEQVDYNTYYSGMGYRGGWYGGMAMGSSHTSATVSTNGTLILDIFDVRTRELVWRGTAKGTVEESASPEQREMRIQEATAGILRPFPARQQPAAQ